ncbi:MAG: LysR family transcriptional regulator, partial [Mesorhizobium sp.]
MPELKSRQVSQLPPLQAIRVFEAVARHLSFTKAAGELGMTQAAASYQIKLLEERVGAPLFLRRPRQIELTEAGQRMAPAVSEAFALLGGAYAAARSG